MSTLAIKIGFKEMYEHMEEYPEYIIAVDINRRIILRNTAAAPDAKQIIILKPEASETTQTRRKTK